MMMSDQVEDDDDAQKDQKAANLDSWDPENDEGKWRDEAGEEHGGFASRRSQINGEKAQIFVMTTSERKERERNFYQV